jgi:hypothetical protein
MSQYGAYGQALAGRTYDQILAHYYTGTQLGKAGRKELRVLLADGRRAVTVSSTVPFTAADATGTIYKLPKGSLTLRADLEVPADAGAGHRDAAADHPPGQEGAARARRQALSRQARARPARGRSCAW